MTACYTRGGAAPQVRHVAAVRCALLLDPALKGLQLSGQPGDRRRVVRDVFEDAYNYMKSGQLIRQDITLAHG